MLQTIHYGSPPYLTTNFATMYRNPDQFVGGTLWHSFDHNIGYHPDPFYGGIMDNLSFNI